MENVNTDMDDVEDDVNCVNHEDNNVEKDDEGDNMTMTMMMMMMMMLMVMTRPSS